VTQPDSVRPGFADRIARRVASAPLWALTVAPMAVVIAVNGAWHTPSIEFLTAYADKVFDPPPLGDQAYAVFSPLGPLLAWALRLTDSPSELSLLHAVVLAGAIVIVVTAARTWHGRPVAGDLAIALSASATAAVLWRWLGLPDPFIFFGASIAVLAPYPAAVLGSGVLLGFAHFEQAAVIWACLALLEWGDSWRNRTPRHIDHAHAVLPRPAH
jgi:hypothetical protein